MRLMHCAWLLLAACSSEPEPAEPVEPALPPDITKAEEGPLLRLTTDEEVSEGVFHAPRGDEGVAGHLVSAGGKRRLVYRTDGGREQTFADDGWLLPPVGARSGDTVLLCWNELTGPESAPGAMPHPTTGVALWCRTPDGEVVAAGAPGVPSWLADVRVADDGALFVQYHRDQRGWLVGPPQPGDGIFERRWEGGGVSDPIPVDVRE